MISFLSKVKDSMLFTILALRLHVNCNFSNGISSDLLNMYKISLLSPSQNNHETPYWSFFSVLVSLINPIFHKQIRVI